VSAPAQAGLGDAVPGVAVSAPRAPAPQRAGGLLRFVVTLLPYFKPHLPWLTLILLGIAANLGFETGLPLSLKLLVDQALVPRDTGRLVLILSVLAVGALLASGLALVQDFAYARTETAVVAELRTRLFAHLQTLSLGFFARCRPGDLLSRLGTDLAAIEQAVVLALPATLAGSLGVLVSLVCMLVLEWRLALVSMVGILLSFLAAHRIEPRAFDANHAARAAEGAVTAFLQENLGAQPVVKAFGLQAREQERLAGRIGALRTLRLRASLLNYLLQRLPNTGVLLVVFLVVGLGSVLTLRGAMTVGSLVAFHGLLIQMAAYVATVTWAIPQALDGAAAMHRFQQLLDERPAVTEAPGAAELPPLARDVCFDDVSFSYGGEGGGLRGVTLRIGKGTRVAVVGPSGAGKSTLLHLLARFHDPTSGTISFDGHDLRDASLASVRRQLGIVFQESVLFDDTIRENIRVGMLSAGDEAVARASRRAGVDGFAQLLADGLQTTVGERGSRLSGGQRQRVGIARAILREPALLLLDEPTSALDPATEAGVWATLDEVGTGCTVVTVTHRLAPVARADQIVVLDRGRLVEQGTHGELLARGGVYAGLWEKQNGFTLSADGDRATVEPGRLARLPVLSRLSSTLLEELAGLFVTEIHPAGRDVVREGDRTSSFYIVVRGKIAVLRRTPGGEPTRLGVLDDGDYFGEIAPLRRVPRTATLHTLTPCVLLKLEHEPFLSLLARVPEVRAEVEATMVERIESHTEWGAPRAPERSS
jgi:ATP-binding cassette subfamily B protein